MLPEPPAPGRVILTLDQVAELSAEGRAAARELTLAVYPPEQWADWPGRDMEWASPEWCVRVRDAAGLLVSYAGIYLRDAEWGGKPVRVGGVGSVKTHPAARGRGLAARAIATAVGFFRDQPGVGFALLVCEPHLLGYYSRLGWKEFAGRLRVRQRGSVCDYALSRVMAHAVGSEAPTDGTIDLCGPPW